MAENTNQRIIEVDASASVKTVRELQAEAEKARKALAELQAGTDGYAAAEQRATAAQQQLNDAMSIAETQTATERKSIAELSELIDGLTSAKGDLIQQMEKEQDMLKAIATERKALDRAIKENTISEEAASRQKERLLELEIQYKTSLAQTCSALNAVEKQAQAAQGSYAVMSQTLGRLEDAYRQLGEEARNGAQGTELLQQIQSLDTELKNIDASMGNYQRNVVDYDSLLKRLLPPQAQFIVELGEMSTKAGGVPALFKGIGGAMASMTKSALAFVATPLGAVVTAIAAGAALLIKNWDKLKESFGLLSPVEKANQKLEETDAKIKAIESDAIKATTALRQQYIAALQAAGNSAEDIAAAQQQFNDSIDELNIDALTQKAEQYKGAVGEIQTQIDAANTRLQGLNDMLANSTSDEYSLGIIAQINRVKKEIESLSAPLADAQKKYEKAEADLTAEQMRQQEKRTDAAKKAADEQTEAAKKAAEAARKAAQEAAEATEKTVRDTLKIQQGLRKETLENELQTAKENYEQELADFNKTVKEKRISEEAAAAYRAALTEQNEADIAAIRQKYRDKEAEELAREQEEEQQRKKERQNIKLDVLNSNMDNADRQARRDEVTAEQTITDPQALEEELQNIQQRLYESKVALIDEVINSGELDLDAIAELSNQRADLEINNIERVTEAEKKAVEEKKKLAELDKKRRQETLATSASFLDSMSQLVGENTAAGKALAVSSALISTYLSAQQAYLSAFLPTPTPASPILGAINMAAAIASGLMNVKSILSVNEKGTASVPAVNTASSAAAVVNPPAVIEQVPLTRTLTSASEEERLNQMASPQKVYVVYDDIAQAGRNVQVQQAESTF